MEKHNQLTILKEVGRRKYNLYVLCRCDCGNEKVIARRHVRSGATKSCGCTSHDKMKDQFKTHGMSHHKLYRVWRAIKNRCYREKTLYYHRYGGRGITVCEEWKNNFEPFLKWALDNGWKEGLQIDRINNDGNYEPSNCRLVTAKVNNNNTCKNLSTATKIEAIERYERGGVTIISLANEYGICRDTMSIIVHRKSYMDA